MAVTNTGSILDVSGHDRTGVGISPLIIIRVGKQAVGAIQNISITEERAIAMISEVGTDGNIDSVPQRSTNISGDCRRTRFDRLRVTEAFGRDFLHAHAQRIPFDIDIYDNFLGDGSNAIVTRIVNCWVSRLQVNYQATDFVIVDDMAFVAEAIYSTLNNGNAATGGERGLILAQNSIEAQADRGGRRGSLDAPGLIRDFFSNDV